MEINFKVTEEDYIQFNLHHLENSPSQKRLYTILRFIVPMLSSLVVYFSGTRLFNQPSLYWIIVAIVFAVGWIIYYPKEYKRSIVKQVKKMLKEGDNSAVFTDKKLVVEGNDISFIDCYTTEILTKESIQSVKVFDEMIVLYVGSVSAHIIPTRGINGEKRKELLALLNA